jgi:hypothetical protein
MESVFARQVRGDGAPAIGRFLTGTHLTKCLDLDNVMPARRKQSAGGIASSHVRARSASSVTSGYARLAATAALAELQLSARYGLLSIVAARGNWSLTPIGKTQEEGFFRGKTIQPSTGNAN